MQCLSKTVVITARNCGDTLSAVALQVFYRLERMEDVQRSMIPIDDLRSLGMS